MKNIHFQSKTHIILWLESNCPRPAIVRALYEGQVEFFGGFSPIPPTTHPGWILRTTSAHGKIRYVAIIVYQQRFGIRVLKDVPWGDWVGAFCNSGFRVQLYSGDDPEEYKKLKEIWNENQHI